jgi:hypothetical protein
MKTSVMMNDCCFAIIDLPVSFHEVKHYRPIVGSSSGNNVFHDWYILLPSFAYRFLFL